ncbi:hypothetical protein GGH99_007493 [Coemansia sp. RSA 1285]|nr:hypothetical protein EV177_007906 [Coemansia sp. RSA 1804]KAJ2653917.1 hypothetical protein GGH99_007493 [Coemansia sp. RSA 1285]
MATNTINHNSSLTSAARPWAKPATTTMRRAHSMPADTATAVAAAGRSTCALEASGGALEFPVLPSLAETLGRLVWASVCSATRWTAAAAAPTNAAAVAAYAWRRMQWWWQQQQQQSPRSTEAAGSGESEEEDLPPQYPAGLQYGFLQGTFGLPYGGYLVHPPRGALRNRLVLSESMSMFGVLGTQTEIIQCLKHLHPMVFCKTNTQPTYTSDIVVELYTSTQQSQPQAPGSGWAYHAIPLFGRWLQTLFTQQRQLVIRSGRTFTPSDFKPLVRIRVPQGMTLSEIAGVLETALREQPASSASSGGGSAGGLDLTRDKATNIRVMGRSRSASLLAWDACALGSDHPAAHDAAFYLPPYQRYDDDSAHHQRHASADSSDHISPPAYSL